MKTVNNSGSDSENITGKSDMSYDVSVLVATYHPSMAKLLVTLNSILVQRDISYQIVITDDGSGDDFDIEKVKEFFKIKSFTDYEITQLAQNEGTVNNVINGLDYCYGEFVKPLSPGDYLYGEKVLSEWVGGMRKHGCVIGFSDDICYRYEEQTDGEQINTDNAPKVSADNFRLISIPTHPQKNHDFYRNSWSYNYLIFDDPARGAAVIVQTDVLKKYLSSVKGLVIYAEDVVYRMMAGAGERAFFLGKGAILYELGTGISTNGESEWLRKIQADWDVSDEMMLDGDAIPDKALRAAFKLRTSAKKESSFIKRNMIMLRIPGKLRSVMDHRFHTRYTETKVNEDYIRKIHETGISGGK